MPCWIFYQRFEALNSSKKPGASPHPTPLVLRGVRNEKLSDPTRSNRALVFKLPSDLSGHRPK
jgi:hypothetical protein